MADQNKLKDRVSKYIRHNEDTLWFKLEEILYDLTEEIYKRMQQKGMSQRELAQKLGVSDAYVSKILKGNANISLKTLVKLALALDLDIKIELVSREKRVFINRRPLSRWSDHRANMDSELLESDLSLAA